MNSTSCSLPRLLSVLLAGFLSGGNANAQEMEPRAYSNAPIGMNFLLTAYAYSDGALLFDPAVPIQGANATVNTAIIAYAHTFDFGGQSARFGFTFPYADLDANGFINNEYRERKVSDLADPRFALSVNFSGAPALGLASRGHTL